MAIGTVQLIVLGFNHPDFKGEIIDELQRLRESGTVRVIDSLAVFKDAQGEIEVAHLSNLSGEEAKELGRVVGALIGLGIEGEEGMEIGAEAGAEAAADGIEVFSDEDAWAVLQDIPNDTAAALVLIEHHWAVPLRDAIMRAGGFRISDGFISPLDLVEIGLVSAEEAEALHAIETGAPARATNPYDPGGPTCSHHAGSLGGPAAESPAALGSQATHAVRGHRGRLADLESGDGALELVTRHRRIGAAGVAAVSKRLSGTPVTTAMVFVALGLLAGPEVFGGIDVEGSSGTVRTLAEATLALVLFCDASRIDLRLLRADVAEPLRLLGIGLPLTIAAGALAAAVIFDALSVEEAVILGSILAPTDAALGQAVVTEPRVPARIRQALNVESGLNDGICVPLLFAAVAVADVESEISHGSSAGALLLEEIGYGVVGGVVGGLVAAGIVIYAGRARLIAHPWPQVIPAAGAALAYGTAIGLAGLASSPPSSPG